MKHKPPRHSHKTTNTFTFRGFGEKVRGLRVRAGKVLLQRPITEEGETITQFFQTLLKCRELNLTEAFRAFQKELGGDVQTTVQLVHREQHVADCLARHLAQADSLALQPLLDLLVAFAHDLPQEFHQRHFYTTFLPVLTTQHLKSREPEHIEAVFLCLVSLFVVLHKYLLQDELYQLYHVHHYATLLSSAYPWYINELAAQSLVFLLRKLPDKKTFLGMALRKLRKENGQVQGVGRLLAALMKSDVVQRLHSCTAKVLGLLLDLLGAEDIPREPVLETLSSALSLLADHVTARHPDQDWRPLWAEDACLVWPVVWGRLASLAPCAPTNPASAQHLQSVLQVVQVLLGYKQGALVTDPAAVLTHTTNLIPVVALTHTADFSSTASFTDQADLTHNLTVGLLNTVARLLTLPHTHTTTHSLRHTVAAILDATLPHSTKFDFIKQLFSHQRFETDILPLLLHFLDRLVRIRQDRKVECETFALIASLVLAKQPLCNTGEQLKSWQQYPLDFSKTAASDNQVGIIPSLLEERLREGLAEDAGNLEEITVMLLVLPHVSPLDHQDLTPYLTWLLSDSMESLRDETVKVVQDSQISTRKKKSNKTEEEEASSYKLDFNISYIVDLSTRRVLFLVGLITEVLCHILSPEDFLASLSQYQLLKVLKQKPQYRENVHFLRALDLHFTVARQEGDEDTISEDVLQDIYPELAPALASPDPQVRLLVVHIFSLFPLKLPLPPQSDNDSHYPVATMFEVMLQAESVAVTPWSYKDRLRHLSTVDGDHVGPHLPSCGSYNQAPLLLLLGQLYVNFKDTWNPVLEAVASYARTLPQKSFWPLWFSRLKIACHTAGRVLKGQVVEAETDLSFDSELLRELDQSLSLHPGFSQVPTKPDHLNFRDLMWRAMQRFPSMCEAKNRDIIPLFFAFLEEELFPVDYTVAPSQNLRVKASKTNNEAESPEEKRSKDHLQEQSPSYSRKAPMKALCVQLTLFSKFHNPRMLHQTKRLQTMYREFLSHPSPGIQKLALDCIMTYNHPFLTPYKENLYLILDDKSFKNALTLFSIDGSEQCVDEGHRSELMPYLMRILYGKMHFKTGANTSGKNKISLRKAVVLRFLAGARESELKSFLELAFDVLLSHLEGSTLEVVQQCMTECDLGKVVPLSRLQGALTTVENMIEKMGSLLRGKVSFLLRVILYVVMLVTRLLQQREEISGRNVAFLKHLKQQGNMRLVAFFQQFEEYAWNEEEVEAVLEAAVWPSLGRLGDEGVASMTPLLHLLQCWAANPRYFPLLGARHPTQSTLTPLTHVVKLLAHPKVCKAVTATILNMVENLLTLQDFAPTTTQDGIEVGHIPVRHQVYVERVPVTEGQEDQNYGTALLVPHLEGLLGCMRVVLARLGKGETVSLRDLNILTSLTRWVTDGALSHDLLATLVPLLVRGHVRQPEKRAQLLCTCAHLLPVMEAPGKHLRPLLTLFSSLGSRLEREALGQAVAGVASVKPEYKDLANTTLDLDSWDPKMVEEYDYERRLKRYRWLTEYTEKQDSIDVAFCQFLVYTNMYVMLCVEDSSLKDMAARCLGQVVDLCVRLHDSHPTQFKQVMEDKLLPLVRKGLKQEKESVRLEVVSLLRQVVHKCHGHIEKMRDLQQLADTEDEEKDFFSNMAHIQRHRRARALGRVAERLNASSLVLSTETLTHYLLPLITAHFFRDAYAADQYLLSSSVTCLGAVAKVLPWYSYLKLLRTYLNMVIQEDLKHLKLAVRIVDVLLEAFHEEVEECEVLVRAQEGKESKNKHKKKKCKEEEVRDTETNKGKKKTNKKGSKVEEEEMEPDEKLKQVKDEGDETNTGAAKTVEVSEEGQQAAQDKKDSGGEKPLTMPQKVYRTLLNSIIPQLQKTLSARTRADTEHKLNKRKHPEDEDVKRIPLAFALVKLLQKLPGKVLEANINSILMKLITFLKSRALSIREEARKMLVKVLQELGGEYVPLLVNDLQSTLTRGYQAHVLVYSLHAVLSQLRPMLAPIHVDPCVASLVDICKEDILGVQAEEKEVSHITNNTREAKSDKGYDILTLAAEFVSAECLGSLVVPLKEVLATTQDKKVVMKMTKCLAHVSNGLERNNYIPLTQKSIFIFGILDERLPHLTTTKKEKEKEMLRVGKEPTDAFLLDPEPKRNRLEPKTSLKATSHVLLEFSLKLLHNLLKQSQFVPKEADHCSLLDPYVAVLGRCISSDHPEVSVQALKCLSRLIKFPLPSLQSQMRHLCRQMFVVLHKFSSPGLAKGKLFELVQLCFRTLALIIKTVESFLLEGQEVKALLRYVEGNLENRHQQQTAFAVLQAVVARKVDANELHEMMKQVQAMSVTCSRPFALTQARVTYYSYLLTYPMKPRRIKANMLYFLGNISYALEQGRISASTMISAIVANFPAKLFDREMETNIWFKLSEQLIKEDSKENQQLVKRAICTLFQRSERKEALVKLGLKFLQEDKDHKLDFLAVQLGAMSFCCFLDIPNKPPEEMLTLVTPQVVALLQPSRYNFKQVTEGVEGEVANVCQVDTALCVLLELATKLVKAFQDHEAWGKHSEGLWGHVQSHLCYPHLQVRVLACNMVGLHLAGHPVEGPTLPCLASSTQLARALALDLCQLLHTEAPVPLPLHKELALSVVRNIIFLVRQSAKVPLVHPKVVGQEGEEDEEEQVENEEESKYYTENKSEEEAKAEKTMKENGNKDNNANDNKENVELVEAHKGDWDLVGSGLWVLHRLGNMAYQELQEKGRESTQVRQAFLNLIAGLVVVLGSEKLKETPRILSYIMRHLARELSDEHTPKGLVSHTQEVAGLVKEQVGLETYTESFTVAQTAVARQRLDRRTRIRQQMVKNPQLALKLKRKKQDAQKEAKKRKISERKGKVAGSRGNKGKRNVKLRKMAMVRR